MASRRKPRQRISYVLPLANSPGGHRLGVNSLALDVENSILYSGGRDGILCAWEIDNSQTKPHSRFSKQIHAHTHWVNDIVLADSKRALVSASSDITVKVWRAFSEDSNTAKDIGKHNDYIKCLANPSESSDWVASGGLDHTIRIWDLNGAGEKLVINTGDDESKEKGSIYALCARPSIIASGGPDSILRLWDPKSGKRITKFVGHTDNVRSILINETGDVVMTASSDQTIKVWSVTAGRCVSTLTMHNDSVWSLYSDHPQLSLFYSADRSGIIAKTDVKDSENLDQGLSVAVAHEQGGVAKLIAGGGSIWSATASSSINRWEDIDIEDPLEAPESPAQMRISSLVSRSRTSEPDNASSKEIPLSCVLNISNTIPHSFREFEENLSSTNLRRMSEVPIGSDEEEELKPYHDLPSETIEGQNGLIKHEILNDRKRVLTLDTAGEVVLWDLIRCIPIKSFGKRHLDDVRPEVDTMESIANWCTVNTKAGNLTVALEANYCFDAEVYADEADIESIEQFKEDGRINIGKWVLRYLFSGLIDQEIKRDEDYRKKLEGSQPIEDGQAKGLSLGPLPPRRFEPLTSNADDDETITTPRAAMNGMHTTTPGLSIGVASPGLSQVMSNSTSAMAKTPGGIDEKPRLSGDYFSTKPPPVPPNPKGTEGTGDAAPSETPVSPNEGDEKVKSPGLFGKKFRLPLKKLGRTNNEAPKPAIVEDKIEEPDKTSEKEEIPVEDNFYGVLQKIRNEYDQHLQHYPEAKLLSALTPSLPNETPVIKPPPLTAILIQEDAPESGGLADLYRGTVGSVGSDADKIEKLAPMWLGELLLRNQTPFKDLVKVSFVLHPLNDLLPPVSTEANARLNANRMLRAKKIISYVTERIDPNGAQEENALKPEDYIEIYCHDQLVSPNITLATLRAHVWRTGGDVILYYKSNGKKPHLESDWVKEKARLAEEAEKATATSQAGSDKVGQPSSRSSDAP